MVDLSTVPALLGQGWVAAILGAVVGAVVALLVANLAIRRITAEMSRQVSELGNVIGYVRIQMVSFQEQIEKLESQIVGARAENDRLVASLERTSQAMAGLEASRSTPAPSSLLETASRESQVA